MFHPACKLIVITEHFLCDRVWAIAEAGGARGHTFFPVGGKGLQHPHPAADKATVAEGIDTVQIEIVCKERGTAEGIAERLLAECFREFPGILYLEPVEILRPERF